MSGLDEQEARNRIWEAVTGETLIRVVRWIYAPDVERFGEARATYLADGLTVLHFKTCTVTLQPRVESMSIDVQLGSVSGWNGAYQLQDVSESPFWKRVVGSRVVGVTDPDEEALSPGSDYVLSFVMQGQMVLSARLDANDDRLYFSWREVDGDGN